jgi:hypothetical protein
MQVWKSAPISIENTNESQETESKLPVLKSFVKYRLGTKHYNSFPELTLNGVVTLTSDRLIGN